MKRTKPYQVAIVKFNNGVGALLCNKCNVIIANGHDHEDKVHHCFKCKPDWNDWLKRKLEVE